MRQALDSGLKRGFDVVVAVVLLLVIAPLSLLVMLLIQIESPGSPFYRARRVGRHGRPLDVLKFRKMHSDAQGLPLTVAGDARLTRMGAFMARTRIDELPQLWNVLRGQMSLVGPRPEDPQFVALHAESYERILCVRPGITGWSQLAFAAESRILDRADPVGHYVATILPAKVQLDCMYAERPRVHDDVKVLAWTAVTMLTKIDVAVHRGTGRLAARAARPAAEVRHAASASAAPHVIVSRIRAASVPTRPTNAVAPAVDCAEGRDQRGDEPDGGCGDGARSEQPCPART